MKEHAVRTFFLFDFPQTLAWSTQDYSKQELSILDRLELNFI